MSHPFEVGKIYRNRMGQYTVQEIVGDRMTIRYEDGRTLDTPVHIQARIWENIQFEHQMAMAEERKRLAVEERKVARRRAARARRERTKPRFAGFEESDFEPRKRGLSWRTRKELGRVLAYELTQQVDGDFDFAIVPRRSAVHVARKEKYDTENRETNAAFLVSAGEDGLSYGFAVGKPGGRSKVAWPWRALVDKLGDTKSLGQTLHEALKEHDLQIDVWAMKKSYTQVAQITAEGEGFLHEYKDAEQEISQKLNGAELAEYLKSVAPTKRCELHVRKRISPEEAVEAGAPLSEEILAVVKALMPIYDASVAKQ